MSDIHAHLFTLLAPVLAVAVRSPRGDDRVDVTTREAADSSTATIGARLRSARRQRGFSLHEVADVTKISVRALHAMEEDAFEQLPGGLFRRAYLKAYATAVGLDARPLVTEYLSRFEGNDAERAIPCVESARDDRTAQFARLALVLAAGLSVLLAWQWFGQAL